jgi:hypothetical protein
MVDYLIISVGAILLVGFGVFGIIRKGGDSKKKELRQANLILAIGALGCGLMYLGYLAYRFWFR